MASNIDPANAPQSHPQSVLDQATLTNTAEAYPENEKVPPEPQGPPGGLRFWLVIVSLMMATFVSALDVTAVSTALPTIVNKLHGREFVWVGSAYNLASTAFLPLSGGLAQIFGRKPVILGSLLFFMLGSGLCGGAKSLNMLIAGRTVQGVGTGGILSLTEIIIADLVPLTYRGVYQGIFGGVWAVAAAAGPPIGGAFSESAWRWLFYMNVPLSGVATLLVFLFLDVRLPTDDFNSKMRRMDWIGNFLVISSSTATIIALTWGGARYPWNSFRVLVPLVLGLVGLGGFVLYEGKPPREPVVPWQLFNTRTAASGYLGTFWHGIAVACVTFYIPVYFQAVKVQSPIRSGVSFLGTAATIAPGAIVAGATVTTFKKYRPQNYVGWILITVGAGLLTILHEDTKLATWVGVQIPMGIGLGFLFTATTFPILAPVPITETAHALALLVFVRNFALTWGVTIGATILQNQLTKKLPQELLQQFTSGGAGREFVYALIPAIKSLPPDQQQATRIAFADSLRTIWFFILAIGGVGLASTLLQKELSLHEVADEAYGMRDKPREGEVVKA